MRYVLFYVGLVGTPFLGLLGILWIGQSLSVPPSIGGMWALEPETVQAIDRSCSPLSFRDDDPIMAVSQSGRYVQVRFNDAARTAMSGRLRADTLSVHHVMSWAGGAPPGCGQKLNITLTLTLRRSPGEADHFSGWWTIPACAACPAQSFVAARAATN